MQEFQQDCVELALRQVRRGKLSRRAFVTAMAAMGGPALAQQARQLVMVNWGGTANQAFERHYAAPFKASHPGWDVVQDSTGPSAGRIRSMVESGRVTWDLCDSSPHVSHLLGRLNMANRVDYSVVKREDMLPGFALEFGAAPYAFSSVLAYDSTKFPTPPTSWADFWDVRRFPGKRTMRRDAVASLEAASMAMGNDPAKLYPLDVRAATRKAAELRPHTVYWTSGGESEQLMRTGEAAMGILWHTRASVVEDDTQGRIKYIWAQGLLNAGIFVSPRGNPGGAMAQQLLASMTSNVDSQLGLLAAMGNGPTNPRAAALVPPELRRRNPTDPDNARRQIVLNGDWWGANYQAANADYIDAITG